MGVRKRGLLCLVMVIFPFQAAAAAAVGGGGGEGRVDVWVYYEALCPFCANFIVNHLEPNLLGKGIISIVNLRMVPWGNALLNATDGTTFICQHGTDECILNTVEACAISAYPQTVKQLGFIRCVEQLSLEGKHKDWAACFNASGLEEAASVTNCSTSGFGKRLELQFANETARLDPPHTYVPWVVVNDRPIREDYENFASHVCKAYKGDAMPDACKSLPSETEMAWKEVRTAAAASVCYGDVGREGRVR